MNALRLLPSTAGSLMGVEWLASMGAGRGWFVVGMAPLFLVAAWWLWTLSGAPRRAGGPGS